MSKEQRDTFEEVADTYAEVRPQVPEPAVAALLDHLALPAGAHLVEVGCGTGQLTKHIATPGVHVTAIDPGARLLALCARTLADRDITFVESSFEHWDPPGPVHDAVAACQSAHWIDPAAFLDKAASALRPGGRVGFLWHIDTSEGSTFWKATQALYEHYLPDAPGKPPQTIPLHLERYVEQLHGDARYAPVPSARFPWTRRFDAETYALLLRTHSPVRMLAADDRAAFIEGHRRIIEGLGGEVDRTYETVFVGAMLEA